MNDSTSKNIQIIGAGGHAKVIIQTARAAGFSPLAVFDDNGKLHGQTLCGVTVAGKISDVKNDCLSVIAIGNNSIRKKISDSLELKWATIIHPSAIIDPTVKIGDGTVVFAGVVIQVDVVIGKHVIINTSASIDHDCQMGDYVHIAPGCHTSGVVQINEGTLLGVGSCVKPLIKIGSWCTIGAGAAVVSDIPDHVTAVGVPAKILPSSCNK